MNGPFSNILLWTFASLLLMLGVVQIFFLSGAGGGWSSIAIGASLIVIALSTRKKVDHG